MEWRGADRRDARFGLHSASPSDRWYMSPRARRLDLRLFGVAIEFGDGRRAVGGTPIPAASSARSSRRVSDSLTHRSPSSETVNGLILPRSVFPEEIPVADQPRGNGAVGVAQLGAHEFMMGQCLVDERRPLPSTAIRPGLRDRCRMRINSLRYRRRA